jgi:acetylornithine deacetylase/succinyl-diaminopimelate desuccinylase-like protein
MVSGAGHDAAIMSSVTPVAMLFVKCFKNIGENPPEVVEINDIAKALEVSDLFIQQLLSPPEKLFRKKEK